MNVQLYCPAALEDKGGTSLWTVGGTKLEPFVRDEWPLGFVGGERLLTYSDQREVLSLRELDSGALATEAKVPEGAMTIVEPANLAIAGEVVAIQMIAKRGVTLWRLRDGTTTTAAAGATVTAMAEVILAAR